MGYVIVNGELCHYGVKGMKWGVRKKQPESTLASNVRKTKAEYRNAKKAYNKAFNKADNRSLDAFSLSKKRREANDARWEDAFNKGKALNKAKTEYKTAKSARKKALKSTTDKLRKEASFADKLLYNDATRKQAAKYVVDRNMSVAEATKKAKGDAWRNTAIFVAAYGAIAVAGTIASKKLG